MMKMAMGMRMRKSKQAGARAISCAVILSLCLSLMPAAWAPDWMPGPEPTALAAEGESPLTDGTLNVLEITPNVNQNSLGYYVAGSEPQAGWKSVLETKSAKADRENYLTAQGLMGTGDTAPLKLTTYTEKYPWDTGMTTEKRKEYIDNHRALNFADYVTDTATGYVVDRSTVKGAYSYDGGFNYAIGTVSGAGANSATDQYALNVDYFKYLTKSADINSSHGVATWYYKPNFEKISIAAYPSISTDTNIYHLKNGEYEYWGKKKYLSNDGLESEWQGWSGFVSITYRQAGISSGPAAAYSSSNPYGAVVSSADPYYPSSGGPFYRQATGTLTFEGAQQGNWGFIPGGTHTVAARTKQVYYDLSYTNNNWFRTKILNDTASATMNIKAPNSVNAADVSAAELICLSAGFLPGGTATAHSKANDISAAAAKAIYREVTLQKRPIIVDYDVVKDLFNADDTLNSAKINDELSNLQKLALMCLVDEPSPLSIRNFDNLSYSFLNGKLTTLTADADKSFVKDNVFCFGSLKPQIGDNIENLATGKLAAPLFANAGVAGNIRPGLEDVVSKYGGGSASITMADIIRYIIEFETPLPPTVTKGDIKVLELQPAAVASHLTPTQVAGWLPPGSVSADKIQVISMTTSEFVGRIEDLRETYDLIYIGDDISGMNNNGASTVYNDSGMNGLIYSSIGDTYRSDISLTGLLDRDYYHKGQALDAAFNDFLKLFGVKNADINIARDYYKDKVMDDTTTSQANLFRFSGNDINESAYKSLVAYSAADYPIVLGDKLISGGRINTGTVDESSWLYKALDQMWQHNTAGGSVVSRDRLTSTAYKNGLAWYLNRSKVKIEFADVNDKDKYPVPYALPEGTTEFTGLTRQADGAYYLEYDFTISNENYPDGSYDCRLYVDVNADGRFREEDKERLKMEITSGGSRVDWTKANADDEFGYYELTAGIAYSIKCKLASNMVGIIPWKLVVASNDNEHDVASALDFTRVPPKSPITLNVLQIMEEGKSDILLNLQQQREGTNRTYTFTEDDILYETKGAEGSEWYEFRDVNGNVNWAEKAAGTTPNDFMATLKDVNKYPIVCFIRSVPNSNNEADFYRQAAASTVPVRLYNHIYYRNGDAVVDSSIFNRYDYPNVDSFNAKFNTSGAPILYVYAPSTSTTELVNDGAFPGTGVVQLSNLLIKSWSYDDKWRWLDTAYDIYKFEDMDGDGTKEKYSCEDIQIKYDRYKSESGIPVTDLLSVNITHFSKLDPANYIDSTDGDIPLNKKAFVKTVLAGEVQNYRSWGRYDSSDQSYHHLGATGPGHDPGSPVDATETYPHSEITYPGDYEFIYQTLFDQVKKDFGVQITTIETDDLEDKGDQAAIYKYLDGYDMLILGFGDTFEDVEEKSAHAILQYINNKNDDGSEREGYKRAVLFSHDTTSPINVDGDDYVVRYGTTSDVANYSTLNKPTLLGIGDSVGLTYWGYWFNTLIRDVVGLDRYGVSEASDASKPHDSTVKPEIQGFTNYTIIHNNVDNVTDKAPRQNTYFYTNNTYRNADATSKVLNWSSGNVWNTPGLSTTKYSPYYLYQNYNETPYISQVNKGQITTYPYDLNTEVFEGTKYGVSPYITVGDTHEQYYQLNTGADDIIVWYCLSDGGVVATDSYYQDVPNDVRNAYYIYTKDNITYTGMGHSSARENYEGKKGFIEQKYRTEAELFVNTIIAAYRPGMQEPTVELLDPAPGNLNAVPPKELKKLEDENLYFTRYGETYTQIDYDTGKLLDADLIDKEKFLQDSIGDTPNDAAAFFFQITGGSPSADYTVDFSYRQRTGGSAIGDSVLGTPFQPEKVHKLPDTEITSEEVKESGKIYYHYKGLKSNNNPAVTSYSIYRVFLPDDLVDWLREDKTHSLEITINVSSSDKGPGQPAVINIRQNELQSLY